MGVGGVWGQEVTEPTGTNLPCSQCLAPPLPSRQELGAGVVVVVVVPVGPDIIKALKLLIKVFWAQ